jgi:hypothetical protein
MHPSDVEHISRSGDDLLMAEHTTINARNQPDAAA